MKTFKTTQEFLDLAEKKLEFVKANKKEQFETVIKDIERDNYKFNFKLQIFTGTFHNVDIEKFINTMDDEKNKMTNKEKIAYYESLIRGNDSSLERMIGYIKEEEARYRKLDLDKLGEKSGKKLRPLYDIEVMGNTLTRIRRSKIYNLLQIKIIKNEMDENYIPVKNKELELALEIFMENYF